MPAKPFGKINLRLALITFALSVITVFAAWKFGHGRAYFLTSFLIISYAVIPFFLSIEQSRPSARIIAVTSVLCGLAVVGRAAFYLIPQVKPMAAIVIISGIFLGARGGFLVGSVSMFVSNFLFGQGPITPWQMLGMGLIGLAAGLCFYGKETPHLWKICLLGGFTVFALYGILANTGAFLTAGLPLTTASLFTCYLAGVPFDAVHAGATILFLLIMAKPMLQKLERLKVKYGLLEK